MHRVGGWTVAKKKDVSGAPAPVSRVATETAEPLPKIRGAVCAQWRVYKGKRLGPYYFLFWREDGKLRKKYIRKAELAATIAACAAFRDERRQRRTSHKEAMQWIRQYSRTCREMERLLKLARLLR